MVSSIVLLALATAAAALKVTSPSESTVWTVGEDATVEWQAVSSDQDSFNVYLSNFASYPTTTTLLASDVKSDAGSVKVDGSKFTAGDSFTINFTNGTETEQIYAQSSQFNITKEETTSSSSSSSSSSTATSSDASSSTGSATTTGTSSSSTASTTDGSSSSTDASSTADSTSGTSTGGATKATSTTASTSGAGKIVAGWMGVIALAVLAL